MNAELKAFECGECAFAQVAHSSESPELLAELFACYDSNNTGKVSLLIVKNILQNCGEVLSSDEVAAVVADLGNSTEIDYREFCKR